MLRITGEKMKMDNLYYYALTQHGKEDGLWFAMVYDKDDVVVQKIYSWRDDYLLKENVE